MPMEYKNLRSFPLRLSPFMQRQAEVLARRAGISLHHFIVLSVMEKLNRAGINSSAPEAPFVANSTSAPRAQAWK